MEFKMGWLTGGLIEGAADAGSSDIDRTAFKIKISRKLIIRVWNVMNSPINKIGLELF